MKVLIFLYLICSASGPLPKNARRVSSCPESKNLTAWRSAAKRLNCSEYRFSIEIIEEKHFYHCLPSGFVNETIEFCGPTTAIEKGHCPIYKYEYGATVATSRSCASFTTGCSDPKDSPYPSWTFLNYYECWNINTEYRCFYAEPNCPREEQNFEVTPTADETTYSSEKSKRGGSDKIETSISTDETMNKTGTTTMSTTVVTEVPFFVWILIVTLGSLLAIFIVVLVGLLFICDIQISKKGCKKNIFELTNVVIDPQGTTMENSSEMERLLDPEKKILEGADHVIKIPDNRDVNHRTSEKPRNENNPETSNEVCIHPAKCTCTSNELKECLKKFWSMSDDTLEFLKNVLVKKDILDENSLREIDTRTVWDKMSDVIKLEFNMSFLQWIFAEKEEYDFAKECKNFSPWNKYDITFNMGIIPGTNSRYLQFQMHEEEMSEEYPKDIDDLRAWLAKLINASCGKILMTALEKAPLRVTYRMDLQDAEKILKFLSTDEGQTEAYHKKVKDINILEIKNVLTIEKPVNGSNFVNLTLKDQSNQTETLESRLKKVVKEVTQKSGVKIMGPEVYLQARSSDKQGEDSKGDSDFARKFLDKNKQALLDNLEPSILMKENEISSLFDNDAVKKMSQIGSRREQVERFLELCNNLSEDDFKRIMPDLEKCVPESKSDACNLQIDQFRDSINKNRDFFLEEIDKDFVETTLNKIGSVSSDIETLWNGNKPRKEKVGKFLDFVLSRDDCIQAFQETMVERGMEFD